MIIYLEVKEKKKIWVNWSNELAWQGDIVAYQNRHTNQIISKKTYNEMIEREILDFWLSLNENQKKEYSNFKNFRQYILSIPDSDFIPLVEIIVSDNEDLEKYKPYIEVH